MTTDLEIFEEITRLLKTGERLALCTVIEKKGSSPRNPGTKMVVSENGHVTGTIGGGRFERIVIDEASQTLDEDRPRVMVFNLEKGRKEGTVETDLICGGEIKLFIDVIKPKPRLIMIGAGHVAFPLARMADIVGFQLTVLDDNEKLASKERFPMAESIINGDFSKILSSLDISPRDNVVVLHGEPEHDLLALRIISQKHPAYLGLLGSKSKAATLIAHLKQAGLRDKELQILRAPVGLDICAETPEEIAISILAELIKEGRTGRKKPHDTSDTPV